MPKLPKRVRRLSSQDLVGAVKPPSDPGLRVPNIGGAEGQALETLGKQVQGEAEAQLQKQFAAQARRQDRQDQIQGVKSSRVFNQAGKEEFTKLMGTEDISLQETQDGYLNFINSKKAEALTNYKGSAVGREKLELKLEQMGNLLLDDSTIAGEKEQRRVLGEQINEDIDAQVIEAQADPTMIAQSLANIEQILIDNENTLSPEQEDGFRADGQRKVYTSAMNTFLFQGTIDSAIDLINDPRAQRAMGAEKVNELRTRIKKFEDSKAEDPGLEDKVDELKTVLGREPTESEKLSLAGIKGDSIKQNKLETAFSMIKTADENGFPFSDTQKETIVNNAVGLGLTPEQKGIDAATEQIAKNATLAAADELSGPGSDLLDESGNVKNEVSNTVSTLLTEAFGGVRDVDGKVTGLTPEQAKFLIPLKADAEQLILNGKAKGVNEAVQTVLADRDLPGVPTFADAADELLKAIAKPNESDETAEAAAFDKVDLDNASGPTSAWINFTNKTFGAFFDSFIDTQNVKDRNKLKSLALEYTRLVRAGERPSVFNQQRMEQVFGGPSLTKSGEFVRAEMRSLRDQLKDANRIDRLLLANPLLPEKSARDLMGTILNTSRFINKLDRFDLVPGGSEVVSMNTPEDAANSSDKDFKKFMGAQTADSFKALPKEVKAALKERSKGKQEGAEAPAEEAPAGELTSQSQDIISKASDEDLNSMLEQAKENRPEMVPFLEAELSGRANTEKDEELPGGLEPLKGQRKREGKKKVKKKVSSD